MPNLYSPIYLFMSPVCVLFGVPSCLATRCEDELPRTLLSNLTRSFGAILITLSTSGWPGINCCLWNSEERSQIWFWAASTAEAVTYSFPGKALLTPRVISSSFLITLITQGYCGKRRNCFLFKWGNVAPNFITLLILDKRFINGMYNGRRSQVFIGNKIN